MYKLIVAMVALAASGVAGAGPTAVPLGGALGITLSAVLGTPFGALLPLAGGGVLLVAASSLVVGIRIARRKRKP